MGPGIPRQVVLAFVIKLTKHEPLSQPESKPASSCGFCFTFLPEFLTQLLSATDCDRKSNKSLFSPSCFWSALEQGHREEAKQGFFDLISKLLPCTLADYPIDRLDTATTSKV